MKNQANVIPPTEHNKLLVSDPKEKDIQDLLDIEFKIIAKRFSESYKKTQINSAMKSRNQYKNKIISSTER